ncbi:hypothetical protein BVX97_00960 [bacterium E08(2017)]|nr:hypothetical protein BVX97_00960 [bacterium E08(2017)]
MNILVDIGHPGHVHFYKNAIREWKDQGHSIFITAREISVVLGLLRNEKLEPTKVIPTYGGKFGKHRELIKHNHELIKVIRDNNIDRCTSIGGTYMVFAAAITKRPSIVFTDTDTALSANRITFPFATKIVTPKIFPIDLGKKHLRYSGLHELAYLGDDFHPDPGVLSRYNLKNAEAFSIVRLSSWQAAHDVAITPASLNIVKEFINMLGNHGRVIIIPEGPVHNSLTPYTMDIKPEDFHHLLAFARMCVTEGATTASEACVLGTPCLYTNPAKPCYIPLLEKHQLLLSSNRHENIITKTRELMSIADHPENTASNRRKLLDELCETHSTIVNTVLK